MVLDFMGGGIDGSRCQMNLCGIHKLYRCTCPDRYSWTSGELRGWRGDLEPSSTMRWYQTESIEVSRCEVHRLTKGAWRTFTASVAPDLLSTLDVRLGVRPAPQAPESEALEVVLGSGSMSRALTFDAGFDSSGKLVLLCGIANPPKGTPTNCKLPHSFSARVASKRRVRSGPRERYTLELRRASTSEVLCLVIRVEFGARRLAEAWQGQDADQLSVPVNFKSLKTNRYWSAREDSDVVVCDRLAACCDEAFMLTTETTSSSSSSSSHYFSVIESKDRVLR